MPNFFKITKAMHLLLVFALYSYSLHLAAMTMGDIQVKSVLGQPLLAQVKIQDADGKLDESCFTVTSEDPDHVVTLRLNPNDALITIQSLQAIAKPAMVLTLFNHCLAPSKRDYVFFVNAPGSSPSSEPSKNGTPAKTLSDQFHYQRAFNKLTKQINPDDAGSLPNRFIRDDQPDSRLNNKATPIANEVVAMEERLRPDQPSKALNIAGEKRNKPTDKIVTKPLKSTFITQKPESAALSPIPKMNVQTSVATENKLALAKTISPHVNTDNASITSASKVLDSKSLKNDTHQSETKPPLNSTVSNLSESLGSSKSDNAVEAEILGDLNSSKDYPASSDELLSAEKHILELQAQLSQLYTINSSLDNLFKKVNLELTDVKKENDFLRSLALCLSVSLMLSGFFFADWLRRKKSQPQHERESAIWSNQDLSDVEDLAINAVSTSRQSSDSAQTRVETLNRDVSGQTFTSTNQTNENMTARSDPISAAPPTSPSNPNLVEVVDANNVDPFDVIPDFKTTLAQGLNSNKPSASVNPDDLASAKLAPAPNKHVESESFEVTEETKLNAPLLINPTPAFVGTTPASIPTLTVTRVAASAPTKPSSTNSSDVSPSSVIQEMPQIDGSLTSTTPRNKEVVKVQPAGVLDDVDVFLSHGRTNLAIQLLQSHLMEHPKESALVWILLLDLLAKEGKRREYEITSDECRKHFNITLSDFSVPTTPHNDSIESFERISAALQKVWGTPLVLSFIDELIYNTRLVPRIGFNRTIFDELMLLRELAEDELRKVQKNIEPTPASQTNTQVSDEFKQLAEDLKTQDQRKEDVNQYLTEFEFILDEPNN